MAVCRQCAHRFQVEAETIRRRVTVPADTGIDADNPLLLGFPVERPPLPPRPAARPKAKAKVSEAEVPEDPGIAIGDLVGQPQAELWLKPIQPVLKFEEPSEEVARAIAQHRAERALGRRVLTLVAVLVVLVVAVGGVLLMQGLADPGSGGGTGVNPPPPPPPQQRSFPKVTAELLKAPSWLVQTRGLARLDASPVTLVDGKFDTKPDGTSIYRGNLKVGGRQVIEEARLWLMLSDRPEAAASTEIFARIEIRLMLLDGQGRESRPIAVTVPQALVDRAATVLSWVKVDKITPGAKAFSSIDVTPPGPGTGELKVRFKTEFGKDLQRAAFFIRALNADGVAVGRWVVDSDGDDWDPDNRDEVLRRLEFVALLETDPAWGRVTWEVVGAGVGLTR